MSVFVGAVTIRALEVTPKDHRQYRMCYYTWFGARLLPWSVSPFGRTPASRLTDWLQRSISRHLAAGPSCSTPFLAADSEGRATGYRSRGSDGTQLLLTSEDNGQGVEGTGNCSSACACGDDGDAADAMRDCSRPTMTPIGLQQAAPCGNSSDRTLDVPTSNLATSFLTSCRLPFAHVVI